MRAVAASWIVATTVAIGWSMAVPMSDLGFGWVVLAGLAGLVFVGWIRMVEDRWIQPIGDRVGAGLSRPAAFAGMTAFWVVLTIVRYVLPVRWPLELDPTGHPVQWVDLPPMFGIHIILGTFAWVFALVLVQGLWEWRRTGGVTAKTTEVPLVAHQQG